MEWRRGRKVSSIREEGSIREREKSEWYGREGMEEGEWYNGIKRKVSGTKEKEKGERYRREGVVWGRRRKVSG